MKIIATLLLIAPLVNALPLRGDGRKHAKSTKSVRSKTCFDHVSSFYFVLWSLLFSHMRVFDVLLFPFNRWQPLTKCTSLSRPSSMMNPNGTVALTTSKESWAALSARTPRLWVRMLWSLRWRRCTSVRTGTSRTRRWTLRASIASILGMESFGPASIPTLSSNPTLPGCPTALRTSPFTRIMVRRVPMKKLQPVIASVTLGLWWISNNALAVSIR